MSYSNILAQLVSLVEGIKDDTPKIASIFNHEPVDVSDTPAVAVMLDQSGEESDSNTNNLMKANYLIRVMVAKTDNDNTQVALLVSIVDAIADALRLESNRTLNCNAHDLMVEGVSPVSDDQKGDDKIWYVEMVVATRVFKSVL